MTTAPASLRIAADLRNLAKVRHFVHDTALALGADPNEVDDVVQAVDELVTNIMVHGYAGQAGMIELEARVVGCALEIVLRDRAQAFDPTRAPSPDRTLPLEARPLGGMGIYLARQLVDDITHRVPPQGGNELTLTKKAIIASTPCQGEKS
jgi:serine/threonine-protein kinase RsbW